MVHCCWAFQLQGFPTEKLGSLYYTILYSDASAPTLSKNVPAQEFGASIREWTEASNSESVAADPSRIGTVVIRLRLMVTKLPVPS